ncbi:MAG TPA: PEGA domain-containing protein, partial [Pyrinomonadaceae bacterium]|nr:PEGA domain-containing protein [Pyrinomonadaceae bacterium]
MRASWQLINNVRSASCLLALVLWLALPVAAQRRRTPARRPAQPATSRPTTRRTPTTAPTVPAASAPTSAGQTLIVRSEPNASVWLDEVRRGATDAATGQLMLDKVAAGRHTLRVRAKGFTERVVPVLPTQRGTVAVRLTRTTDEAELAFQQAEEARERATDDE